MRRVSITIGLVVVGGCGPNFDSLFAAGGAPDAAPSASPEVDGASPPPPPNDAGDGGEPDTRSDAGCPVTSCSVAPVCLGTGACSYACETCGCVCPTQACPPFYGASCTATCSADTICDVSCNAGTQSVSPGTCTFAAHGAKKAAYSCGANVGACKAVCDDGATCSLSCNQLNMSCSMTCSDTASCLLSCNFNGNCPLDCESGAAQTCLDGSKTCNRKCP